MWEKPLLRFDRIAWYCYCHEDGKNKILLISNYNQSTSFFSVQNYFFANSIKNYRYNHTNIFSNFVESLIIVDSVVIPLSRSPLYYFEGLSV